MTSSDGAAFEETPDRIRLARFTYDPYGPSPLQSFPVVPEIIKMGIPVSDVVFAFNSNWGGNLTCVYRVRTGVLFCDLRLSVWQAWLDSISPWLTNRCECMVNPWHDRQR